MTDNPKIAREFEKHMIPTDEWQTCGAPKHGWAVIATCNQGPIIVWSEQSLPSV